MGCSSSRDLTPPRTPLEVIVYEEARQGQLQRIRIKEAKRINKLRNKLWQKRNKNSKKSQNNSRKRSTSTSSRRNTNATTVQKSEALKLKDLDAEIEEETHALINTDLCMFLLNQTALSLEFFGNFESESTAILAEFLNKENEFNKNLDDQSILLGNPLDAAVQKWLKFKLNHGPEKNHSQPLQAPVIYVVFENIDISRPDDSDYDAIQPNCNVIMETKSYRTTPCKEELIKVLREIQWKGYVRLKLRENPNAKQTNEVTTQSKIKIKEKDQQKKYRSASSGYGTEQDYDYVYMTKLNTQKPLSELKMNGVKKLRQTGAKVIPDSCVSFLGDYMDAELMEDSDDDMFGLKEEGNYNLDIDVEKRVKPFRNMETLQAIRRYELELERRQKLLQQRYINSQRFMSFFAELMRQQLAKQLAIADEDLANSNYRGASVYTKDYEIIPAIHVSQNAQHWPECTAQFRLRERPVSKHPRSGENVQWPTRAMIKQIETFGYHVIPQGYAPRRHRNPFRELEWRIVFPKAERYLERHLSYTQVKILMIMKTLIKTYIEPKESGKSLMFIMELLRTHLFWECERNFTIWPEEFLGDVLLRFIDTFKMSLKQKRLRDYFIQERNLLEGIPDHSIMSIISTLADIAANPLMHCLVAFGNLDFDENFFPKLDLRRIFRNLTAENSSKLKQLSKNSNFFADTECDSVGNVDDLELTNVDPDDLIGDTQQTEIAPEKFSRRACQLLFEMEKAKRERKRRLDSVDSIPVEFFFNNNLPERGTYGSVNVATEFLRRSNLLEVLMDHFLAVLRKSIKLRNLKLSQSWLLQLQRFVKYYRSYGTELLAKDYENSIQLLEDALQEQQTNYGTLNFKNDHEHEDEIAEVNSYEEVLPMQESLPTIHEAVKLRQSKLRKKTTENAGDSKSTSGSHGSASVKDIQVEVHSTTKKSKELYKKRKNKEEEVGIDQNEMSSLSSDEENDTISQEKSKTDNYDTISEKSFTKNSINPNLRRRKNTLESEKKLKLSKKFYSNPKHRPNSLKPNKISNQDSSTAYESQTDSSSLMNIAKHQRSPKTRKETRESDNNKKVNISTIKKRSMKRRKRLLISRKNSQNESYSDEDTIPEPIQDLGKKQNLKTVEMTKRVPKSVIKIQSQKLNQVQDEKVNRRKKSSGIESDCTKNLDHFKGKHIANQQEDFAATYDNEAYVSDSTDEIHENRVQQSQKKQIENQNSTDDIMSVYDTDSSLDTKEPTMPQKSFNRFFPRSSLRSQTSFRENRRITYDSNDDEEIDSHYSGQSSAELEHFEFKCLEDLSEFEATKAKTSLAENKQELDVDELFVFGVVNEKLMSIRKKLKQANPKRDSNLESREEMELKDLTSVFTNVKEQDHDEVYKVNIKLSNCSLTDHKNSPTSISKTTKQHESEVRSDQENWHDIELKDLTPVSDAANVQDQVQEDNVAKVEVTNKSLISKYINREDVLKNLTIISPDMIDTLAESKQKIKESLSEEKRAQFYSVLKKRTKQFKKACLK